MGNSTATANASAALRQRPQSTEFIELDKKLQDQCATPICLSMDFLKAITSDFSEEQELGRGGFGVVYKVCSYISLYFSSSLLRLDFL
jgi:hypothetical protein